MIIMASQIGQGMRTCGNGDQPTTKLSRLVRHARRGERITLQVCVFCSLQLAPKTKRLPR
jgi:hypothetical protein